MPASSHSKKKLFIRAALMPAAGLALCAAAVTAFADSSGPESTTRASATVNAAKSGTLLATFSSEPGRYSQRGGETIYRSVCQACHMSDGRGANTGAGYFPALQGNQKLAASGYPVLVVLNGLHGMPPFGANLDNQQVADLVNYVRTHFGNSYTDPVTPDAVASLRGTAK